MQNDLPLQIVRPFAQRRNPKTNHVQPVIQVLTESTFRNQLRKISIGCGDYASVDTDSPAGAADSFDLLVLQDLQQSGLTRQRKFADFIEKDCSRVCGLELSNLSL
jgi:hypothetical protein